VAMSAQQPESRRAVLAKTAGAFGVAFSGANAAFADGAVSAATIARARGIYGGRILGLSDAVAKGDFEAIKAEKNAFVLFSSGAYRGGGAIAKAVRRTLKLHQRIC
jgi:prepilin-type processing-associated H-X9-DG protein